MQLKTVGESVNVVNTINEVIKVNQHLGNGLFDNATLAHKLSEAIASYSTEAIKMAIAESTLNETQIKAILTKKGLKGEILETTTAELAEITTTNGMSIAQKEATVSTLGLSNAFKGLGVSIKTFVMTNPLAVLGGLAIGAYGLVKVLDTLFTTVEEQIEINNRLKESYDNVVSEQKTLESELSTVRSRIIELNSMDNLTLTEKGELENLKLQNDELLNRIALLKEEAKLKAQDLNQGIEEAYRKDFLTKDVETGEAEKYKTGQQVYNAQTGQWEDEWAYSGQNVRITEKEAFDKNIAKAKELIALGDKRTEQQNQELKDLREQTSEVGKRIVEETKGYQAVTDEQKAVKGVWEQMIADAAYVANPQQFKEDHFNQLWESSDFEQYKDELEKLASSGELTEDTLTSNENYKKLLDETRASASELVDHIISLSKAEEKAGDSSNKAFSKTEMISAINGLSEGFEELDKIYKSISDKDPFDFKLLDDKNFTETFNIPALEKEYTSFIETISSSPDDINACKDAFNDLVSAWIDSTGILDYVDESNAKVTASMLKMMGIENAEAVVSSALARKQEDLAAQKYYNANATEALKNNTIDEYVEFLNEADASDVSKQALAQLELAKIAVNNVKIDTASDIDQVINLANAAGASATALAKLARAKAIYAKAESQGLSGSAGDLRLLEEADKIMSDISTGNFDYQFNLDSSKYKTATYTGGNKTAKSASSGSSDSSKEDYKETFDYFERRVTVLQDAFDGLSASMDNVFGYKAKNTIIGAQADILTEELNNYTDALQMYTEKANRSLEGLDASLQERIKNGAVALTDFTGENGKKVVEAMEAYEGWADKISECSTKLEELRSQLRQLELDKFNNIVEDYTNQFDLYGNSIDLIEKQVALLKESGQLIGKDFYETQIEQTEKQLDVLYSERKRLADQLENALSSGNIETGSDEWLEMVNTMSELDASILDAKTSVEEFSNAILEIKWDTFERIQDRFSNFQSDLENLAELFNDATDIRVSDGYGTWTNEAIATLGLYAQQYELARYQVEQYSKAIDDLKYDYNNGKYSATEYAEKLAELNSGQWEAIKSAESLEDAIISLNKTRVNEEIDVIEELIDKCREAVDARKEELEATRDLHEYEKSIAEKTKTVTNLERQIAAMANDTSLSAIAKRKKLEEELAKVKEDLTETEYDHSIDTQLDALDKYYENYEAERNKEIETLEESLNNREALISQSMETVKENSIIVSQEIEAIAEEHGIKISSVLTDSWKSGENAIASYGDLLSTESSAFIVQLTSVENKEWDLQEQANQAAESLSNMFATKADALVEELTDSYSSASNLNEVTSALQNNLIDTLERGYDISGITSAFDSIASAANSAASAANSAASAFKAASAAKDDFDSGDDEDTTSKYKIIDGYTGKVLKSNLTYDKAQQLKNSKYGGSAGSVQIVKYANGGVISKETRDDLLAQLAQSIGEDQIVAVRQGEGIFTPEQTQALMKLVPTLTNNYNSGFTKNDYVNAQTDKPARNVTLHYDSLVTIHGDVNDTNHFIKQMESVSEKVVKKTFSKLDRDFRYSGY